MGEVAYLEVDDGEWMTVAAEEAEEFESSAFDGGGIKICGHSRTLISMAERKTKLIQPQLLDLI